MQYLYKENMLDMLGFVKHQIEFIEESTKDVSDVNDLLVTMTGMVLYNSTLMCLQTIGETLKNVDNFTDRKFLPVFYPEVQWKSIVGLRNVISHEYLDTDHEEIFNIVKDDLPGLLPVLETIISDVEAGKHDDFLESLKK